MVDFSVVGAIEQAVRDCVGSFEALSFYDSGTVRLRSDSVTLHRVEDFGSEWMWFITCDALGDSAQGRWAWTGVPTKIDPHSWSAHGVAGGSGHPVVKGSPWVNLGGQVLPNGFRAGGWVEDAGREIALGRLVDASGLTLEDRVENQVLLFRSDRPVTLPLAIQLIDTTGTVAATDEWASPLPTRQRRQWALNSLPRVSIARESFTVEGVDSAVEHRRVVPWLCRAAGRHALTAVQIRLSCTHA